MPSAAGTVDLFPDAASAEDRRRARHSPEDTQPGLIFLRIFDAGGHYHAWCPLAIRSSFPLAAILCGIGAARFTTFSSFELGAGLVGLCAIYGFARWKAPRVAPVVGFVLLILAGCSIAESRRPPVPPELSAGDNEVLIVAGCVVEPPSIAQNWVRFVIQLEPGARVRVTLTPKDTDPQPPRFGYGQLVEVEARVRKPRNFGNPGAFDFAGYLARQEVYWTASARGLDKLQVLPGRCGSRWSQVWFDARVWALDRVRRLYAGDAYKSAMLSGMLLGDPSAIEESWTDDFRRTGTYHTLVISGLHITVLAGSMLTLMRLCFLPLGPRLFLAALVAWGYALLTGLQVPVARSAAGFTLFLIARYFFRRGRVLNILAAVALVFLFFDPAQISDASFQLSFLAVAAIGAIAVPAMEKTSVPARTVLRAINDAGRDATLPERVAALRIELRLLAETIAVWLRIPAPKVASWGSALGKLVVHIYDLILVSAAVQLALALPSAAYFHRLPWTSLSANAIAVPALSAAVPVGFIAIITEWSFPAAVTGWLLTVSNTVVAWHARYEPSWRIPDAPLWLQVCLAAALIALAISIYRPTKLRVFCSACVTTILVAIVYVHPFAPSIRPGAMEVTSIDVGQGDSHLVVAPSGATLLVDGGGIPTFDPRFKPRLDIGEDVVSPYLWTRGIKRLDAVALTHAHDDHARGLIAVLENFRPAELWTGFQPQSGVWVELRKKARDLQVRVVERHAGQKWNFGGASVSVLAPASERVIRDVAHNNDSLVLRIALGKHSFLLTGDIERQVESELVASGVLDRVDVLKVAHHGSRTSSTPSLLELVRPTFAVVSAGKYNSYRHPHPDVVERLNAMQVQLLRTDEAGLVSFHTDGKRLTLSRGLEEGSGVGIRNPLITE